MDGSRNLSMSARNNELCKLFEKNDNNHKRKLSHNDLEKLRRHAMSSHHASLRSLLPLEYIKGKRSMSDHMNEAVNYVRDLKNKINELSVKRDKLKKILDTSVNSDVESSNNRMPSRVKIHQCAGGLEVLISSGFGEQGFPVSIVLQVLLKEGLEVVSCVSTKVNQVSLLTIQAEVTGSTCIDLSGLQRKLTEVIP